MRIQYCGWFLAAWLLVACEDASNVSHREASLRQPSIEQVTPSDEVSEAAGDIDAMMSDTDPDYVDSETPDADNQVWLGDDPPLRIEARHFVHSGTTLRDYYVILRSQADYLEIYGLTLNRGNCPYSETNQVVNGVTWPQYLLFGQRKQVRAKCDQVIEAVVQTQFGDWTFTFD